MALKLNPEYTLTLSGGGTVTGKLIDNGGENHLIEQNWTPKKQDLSREDGIHIRQAQDSLRDIAVQLRLLSELEV